MVRLTGKGLTIAQVCAVARGERVALSSAALRHAERSRTQLLKAARAKVIYGVNTGFGPMADRLVGAGELEALQRNLIVSHACGAGESVPDGYVLAAMAVRLNTLLRGDSGVSRDVLTLLAALINARVAPRVPERGGVGASGDLIQLAHIALALLGEGEVSVAGTRLGARAALRRLKLKPLTLGPKEGLSLINGTAFMTGVAALVVAESEAVLSAIVRASALSLEAASAFEDALDPYLHAARPHAGQGEAAALMRGLLRGSRRLRTRDAFERRAPGGRTQLLSRSAQDPYSLRCAPQVLGPALESLWRAREVVGIELNSTTDNPIVSPRGRMLHGGNFHGEYVAAAMDDLKRSLAKASMLSERRLNYFLHAKLNGIYPPFLNLGEPGLTLGLQGLQFTATSTAALNQTLAFPASLHSISSNADNQDIVSMGADAALLAARVVRNAALIAAAELIALSQAVELSGHDGLSAASRALVAKVRRYVPPVRRDRSLTAQLEKLAAAVSRGELSAGLN